MNDHEKIIALAKEDGWTATNDGMTWISPSGSRNARFKLINGDFVSIPDTEILPDYNDRNVLQRLIDGMSFVELALYQTWMEQRTVGSKYWHNPTVEFIREAYLRTKGLWKE